MSHKNRPIEEDGGKPILNVIVETPQGERNKFKYDPKHKVKAT